MNALAAAILALILANVSDRPDLDSLEAVLPSLTVEKRIVALNELAFAYARKSPEQSQNFASQALELAEGAGEQEQQVVALVNLGNVRRHLGEYAEALDHYRQGLSIAKGVDDQKGIALCLGNIGVAYDYLGEYDKALEYYLQSLEISEENADTASVARSLSGMGIVHWYLKNYEVALEHYQRALSLHEALGNSRDVAGTLNNIGLVYWNLDSLEIALEYYRKALPLIEQTGGPRGIADVAGNIGLIYGELEKYDEAITYRTRSLALSEEVGYKWGVASSSINIGDLHLKRQDPSAALPYLEEGLALAKELDAKDLMKQGYGAFSRLYVARSDYKKALEFHGLYSEINDSIYVAGARRAAELQARYDAEKKEQEIALLTKEAVIQDLELARQRMLRNSFIGASVLVLLLAIVIYSRYRLKTRANIELARAMQQLKDTQQQLILKEKLVSLGALVAGLAHEMNNPVGAIKSSADNSTRAVSKIKAAVQEHIRSGEMDASAPLTKALEALEANSQVSVTACERVTHMVSALKTFARLDEAAFKTTDVHEGIDSTLTLLNQQMADRINVVRNYGDIPGIGCYPDQLNQVFMNILLNAAQAIEGAGTITIESSQHGANVRLRFSDTGRGIPAAKVSHVFDPGFTTKGVGVGTGLGLAICYNIIRKHGGEITCGSEVDKGTTFTVTLPIDPKRAEATT